MPTTITRHVLVSFTGRSTEAVEAAINKVLDDINGDTGYMDGHEANVDAEALLEDDAYDTTASAATLMVLAFNILRNDDHKRAERIRTLASELDNEIVEMSGR